MRPDLIQEPESMSHDPQTIDSLPAGSIQVIGGNNPGITISAGPYRVPLVLSFGQARLLRDELTAALGPDPADSRPGVATVSGGSATP